MNKNKNNGRHRRLELRKETVVHLTDDLLKNVVGGVQLDNAASYPVSGCETQCLKNPKTA